MCSLQYHAETDIDSDISLHIKKQEFCENHYPAT